MAGIQSTLAGITQEGLTDLEHRIESPAHNFLQFTSTLALKHANQIPLKKSRSRFRAFIFMVSW